MNKDILVTIEHFRGEVAEISYLMLAAGRALARGTGGELVALLLGYNAQELAAELAADKVLYSDHAALADFTPDAYMQVLAGQIRESKPRAVLFGHTSIGDEILAAVDEVVISLVYIDGLLATCIRSSARFGKTKTSQLLSNSKSGNIFFILFLGSKTTERIQHQGIVHRKDDTCTGAPS